MSPCAKPDRARVEVVALALARYLKGPLVQEPDGIHRFIARQQVRALDDTRRDEALAMVLRLAGRINYSTDRADTAYMLGPDGAAGIVSELIALARRAGVHGAEHGAQFAAEFDRALRARLAALEGSRP